MQVSVYSIGIIITMSAQEPLKNVTLSTDSFELKVSGTETQMKLTLKDKVEACIYQRQFTQDDYGREIHRKAEFQDFVASLAAVTA